MINKNIRKIREIKGFSQDYVATKLGVSQNNYSKIERGEIQLKKERLEEIAKVLEVKTEDIERFNDSVIFNNCQNSGCHNRYTIENPIEKINELYILLLQEKDLRIKQLEEALKQSK